LEDLVNKTTLVKDRILIVGGTGFIGKHIVKEALVRSLQVTIISKNHRALSDRIKDVEYLTTDISKQDNLYNQLKDRAFQYVINLGGYVDHSNYSSGGDMVFNVHFNGTKNLINCINKDSLKSFIQIGSSDEYGANVAPQNESQRESPISPYSFAKTSTTHFLQMLYRTEHFPVIVLRPFLVYGPGQGMERFIPQVIKGCLEGKKFPTSEGKQLRDFCFIGDFVQSIFCSIDNTKAFGEVINIASGEPISIKNVVTKIQDIITTGSPQFGEAAYRSGENMELFADIKKAKKLLNWQPKISLEEGLKKTIDDIKNIDNER
jgi:nucleoside-diphosphate-sugar epimerase